MAYIKLAVTNNFMVKSLSSLLEDGEELKTPFYGTIEKIGLQRHNWYSLIGLTDSALLVAILNGVDASKVKWTSRIPLDINKVETSTSLFHSQIIISIVFNKGNDVRIRAAKKVLFGDLINQNVNVANFIDIISNYR